MRIEVRAGCGKLSDQIEIEARIRIFRAADRRVGKLKASDLELLKNNIKARCVLTLLRAEEMTRAPAETHIGIHILKDMPCV